MGGFNHTVELCPLQATTPQDHGECASFAYVNTYAVDGQVWKKGVKMKGDDFEEEDEVTVAGLTVSLSPVDGKNLAGEEASYTTAEKDNTKTDLNEKRDFNFAGVAAGAYKLNVPDGWRAKMGDMGATADVGNALNPLADALSLDVTPATATVYGRVDGSDGFPLDSVTVTVNGRSAMTDDHGRYIVDGISAVRSKVFVSASRAGYNVAKADSTTITFAANSVTEHDIDLAGVQARATFSGKVISSTGGAAIAGVEIRVDGDAPTNAATSGANKGKLVTGADGTFMAEAPAKTLGETSDVSAHKDGWTFVPAKYPAAAHPGATTPSITFSGFVNATISGRVAAPGGGPLSGVVIEARPASDADADPVDADTTGVTGSFSLSVSGVGGSYGLTATLADHTFELPVQYRTVVNVAPGQTVNIGTIQAKTFGATGVKAVRARTAQDDDTDADETERLSGSITVTWSADTTAIPAGYETAAHTVWSNHTGDWAAAGATPATDTAGLARFDAAAVDTAFMVRIESIVTDTDGTLAPDTIISATSTVGAVDPMASNVKAALVVTKDTTVADTINVTWNAVTNTRSDFRILVRTVAADGGGTARWYRAVAEDAADLTDTARSGQVVIPNGTGATDFTWNAVNPDGSLSDNTITVTPAEALKATMVRVQSLQGTFDADDNPWKDSAAVAVTGGS